MPVSLIAVDMDGTFLRDDKTYDTQRFAALYNRFAARGGCFAAASGKQFHDLVSFFPEQRDEMVFIAENGALVVRGGEKIYSRPLPKKLVPEVARLVASYGINLMLCSERGYVLPGQTAYRQASSRSGPVPGEISLEEIGRFEGDVYKFSLLMPEEEVEQNFKALKKQLSGEFALLSSGFGYLDIMHIDANKGTALEYLCGEWNIPYEERMAFGDAGNDAEMLKRVKHSYAMANATDEVKALCTHSAPGCNEDGVLAIMEQMLNEGW